MINRKKLEFYFFILFVKLFKLLGLKGTRKAASFFGYVLFNIIPVRKKVVIGNLQIAFPDKKINEIEKIALKCYKNICTTFFELMYLPNLSNDQISSMIETEDSHFIIDNYKKNKGVIFLTGHIGSWEIAALTSAAVGGIPMNLLAQPQSNKYITDWLKVARGRFGNKVLELGLSVRHVYEAIKKGELVGIVGDQRGPRDGVRVKFFGKDTYLYPGAVSFALKAGCPIILAVVIRKNDGNYTAIFQQLSFDNLPEDDNSKITELNQRYISFIEKFVRQYPDQYFWMHKIWKY